MGLILICSVASAATQHLNETTVYRRTADVKIRQAGRSKTWDSNKWHRWAKISIIGPELESMRLDPKWLQIKRNFLLGNGCFKSDVQTLPSYAHDKEIKRNY